MNKGTTYTISLKAFVPEGATDLENLKLMTKFTPKDSNDLYNVIWVNYIHSVETDVVEGTWATVNYTFTPEQDYEEVAFSISFQNTVVPKGVSNRIRPLYIDDVLITY